MYFLMIVNMKERCLNKILEKNIFSILLTNSSCHKGSISLIESLTTSIDSSTTSTEISTLSIEF